MSPNCRRRCSSKVRHLGPAALAVCQRLWNEPLLLEVKDRTTISSNTTLPYDEPDYEAALTFALSETTAAHRPVAPRTIAGARIVPDDPLRRFFRGRRTASFQPSAVSEFRPQHRARGNFSRPHGRRCKPVRQIRIAMWSLSVSTLNRRCGARPKPNAGARWTQPRTS